MQENLSELTRKYREEMLRMYGKRQEDAAQVIPEDSPAPDQTAGITEESAPPETDPIEQEPEVSPAAEATESTQEDSPEPDASEPEEADYPDDTGDYGDPELPQYIQPVKPILPAEWQAQEDYEARNTAQGYLRVIAAAADSAYPVPDARVSVFTHIGDKIHLSYLMVTDENGETPTVALPAPPADLSQEPENVRPYASCDIRIRAKGFFPTQASDVHIFAGITTRQVFQLVPLPLRPEPSDEDIDPNAVGRTEDCQGGEPC